MEQYVIGQVTSSKELLESGIAFNRPQDVVKSITIFQGLKDIAKSSEELWEIVVENMIRACTVMCLFDPSNAMNYLNEACKYNPDHPTVLNNMGYIYHTRYAEWDKSVSYYERCLLRDPKYMVAYLGIIDVYRTLRHHTIELEYCRKAVEMCPDSPEVYNCLGLALLHNAKYKNMSMIMQCFRHALTLNPANEVKCKILVNIGHVWGSLGDFSTAIDYYLQSIDSDANHHPAYQNILLNLHYYSDLDFHDVNLTKLMQRYNVVRNKKETIADIIAKLHVELVRRLYANKTDGRYSFPDVPDFAIERDSTRKVSIGYLSADLIDHAVSHFADVLFSHYNRDIFDVYIYANNVYDPDAIASLRCTGYRCIKNATAKEVVMQMNQDRIDILVDLSSHTAGNRLDVIALRPVPIILSYLGYPNDSGFPFVRRISDEYTEHHNYSYLENGHDNAPVRLPRLFLCYKGKPLSKEINETYIKSYANFRPKSTMVTFGCFAKLQKINEHVIAAWVEILKRVPNSRLLLKSKYFADPTIVKEWKAKFGCATIASRVLLLKGSPDSIQHLKMFKLIDIHLDTFPYSGTTITTESLYMNVPVISLALSARSVGHVQRVSGSILQSLGLGTECVAKNVNEYVDKAVKMIARLPHMPSVRKRFLSSEISNPIDFMKHFENTLFNLYWSCNPTKANDK
jgi:protein O-GlcNAc transferase